MAGLTKQHFETIADILNSEIINISESGYNENEKSLVNDTIKRLAELLSNYFKTQNPLFDENRFKKTCLE